MPREPLRGYRADRFELKVRTWGKPLWVGVVTGARGVKSVCLEEDEERVARRVEKEFEGEARWGKLAEARERFRRYARGEAGAFEGMKLDLGGKRGFTKRVLERVRRIGRGEVMSYGEVARAVGSPGASRAVGQVMARNETVLVIPCHRVVGGGGNLGGYSAMGGVRLKGALLAMERTECKMQNEKCTQPTTGR